MMKKIFIALFVITMLYSISIVSAATVTDAHGVALAASTSTTNYRGMIINVQSNVTLDKVEKITDDTATTVVLSSKADGSQPIATATFSGNNATFTGTSLYTNQTYYILVNAAGGTYTSAKSADGQAFPNTQTNVVWLGSVFNGANDSANPYWDIKSITTITSSGDNAPTTTLVSPENNSYYLSNYNITFNMSATDDLRIQNISFYLNGLRNTTITDGLDNFTELYVSLNIPNGVYNWTAVAYDNATQVVWAGNRTFRVSQVIEHSQTFNSTAIEITTQTFIINISYPSAAYTSINATLRYNGSLFAGTQLGSGDNIRFIRTINTPDVSGSTNIAFNWSITLSNATGNFPFNSTTNTQTVNILTADNCSTNTVLFVNYTLRDEETRDVINATFYNSTVQVDLVMYNANTANVVLNFSTTYVAPNSNNSRICLNNDLASGTYDLFLRTRYDGDGYTGELHHLWNSTTTNSSLPINIDLHDLKDTDNTNFLITFKDSALQPVKDAVIQIQRKYIANGTFRIVEMPLTDNNGQAVGHFDTDSVIYSIIVSKDKTTLAVFDNAAVKCLDTVIGDCRINLNAPSSFGSNLKYSSHGNISTSWSFNKNTRVIQVLWTATDNSVKTVLLNATKFDAYGNNSVCSSSLTDLSGTLTCTVPNSYGNISVTASLFVGTKLIEQNIYSLGSDGIAEFGRAEGGIFAVLIVITFGFMMLGSTAFVIVGAILGVIFSYMAFLIDGTSVFGRVSFIGSLIIIGIIIIYKISRRES